MDQNQAFSIIQAITVLISSGVAAGGIGVLKWAITIEKRINRIEVKIEQKA